MCILKLFVTLFWQPGNADKMADIINNPVSFHMFLSYYNLWWASRGGCAYERVGHKAHKNYDYFTPISQYMYMISVCFCLFVCLFAAVLGDSLWWKHSCWTFPVQDYFHTRICATTKWTVRTSNNVYLFYLRS